MKLKTFNICLTLWKAGKNLQKYNIKIGFHIRLFCLNELNSLRQTSQFSQNEEQELLKMIYELREVKKELTNEEQKCSLEEYQLFLADFFDKINKEDRYGKATLETSNNFKDMFYFIDVLAKWGPIDEEMIKCKKYCQYKAVDIYKSLQKGEIPKRGGPNEKCRRKY